MDTAANLVGAVGGRRYGAAPRSRSDLRNCATGGCPPSICPACDARRASMAAHPAGSARGSLRRGSWRSDGGMVTAELAAAIPGSVFVAVVLAWALSLGVAQGQVQAAARDGARAAARGDSTSQVARAVARVAPGAAVRVSRRGRLVQVAVSQRRSPPGSALAGLSRTLRATAVAEMEPS